MLRSCVREHLAYFSRRCVDVQIQARSLRASSHPSPLGEWLEDDKSIDGDGSSGVKDRVIYACATLSYFVAPRPTSRPSASVGVPTRSRRDFVDSLLAI